MLRRIAWTCCLSAVLALGITTTRAAEHTDHGKDVHKHHGEDGHRQHAHQHKAAHGGCLNALGSCENGHAEVKLEDGILKVWFVGGGADTGKAVRIPDLAITLAVTADGEKEARPLILKANPNDLAEEKLGDCSCFEGSADLVKGAKAFVATGTVTFKGKKQAVRLEYPEGYDPD